ncbi:MAG TPA: radical SAM protein [Solirubrobacteraceae bacterium]
MRWSNLTLEAEEQHRLPGHADPAVVRRFDAPEALDMRFYEIRARSILNRVPKASQMPFRWTVNPYRGCSHACLYCISGRTPVLMANGTTRRIDQLVPGDRIYGTELVTSGDHRFLSTRGWKHVTGAEQGPDQRPHLTLGTELLGLGRFAQGPAGTSQYRRGYLCGMVRGDGLALTDGEARQRTQRFLLAEQIATHELAFSAATPTHRALDAIRCGSPDSVERIGELIEWPDDPPDEWGKGFLAGIFDAEGSYSRGILRIVNADPEILARVVSCLERFGFNAVVEDPERPDGYKSVRVRGGVTEHVRFFHTVDPAITRKRSIEGQALKTSAKLDVVSIEPLGADLPLYDITTGTGDFIADGVVSHNCFARPTHTYLDFDAGRDFEREIVVKVNAPERLRADLAKPSWGHEHVALGTNTDPYQWVESRYKLMPGIWDALLESGTPCSVLTKSPLLLRDLEQFQALVEGPGFAASLSVPTLDEKAWRASEPHTPSPRARLEAVKTLNEAGVPTGVLIAPLMPGINDDPKQVEEILALAGDAGARTVGGIALHLRGEVREVFMEWLRSYRPDLVARYDRLYARGAYAPKAERERLAALARSDTGPWRESIRRRSVPGTRALPGRRAEEAARERQKPVEEVAQPAQQATLFGEV